MNLFLLTSRSKTNLFVFCCTSVFPDISNMSRQICPFSLDEIKKILMFLYCNVTRVDYWNNHLNLNLQLKLLILQDVQGCVSRDMLLSSLTRKTGYLSGSPPSQTVAQDLFVVGTKHKPKLMRGGNENTLTPLAFF